MNRLFPSNSPDSNIRPMNTAPPPIMVVGVDRSGTTLLSLMLDSHSRIAIPYESKFFMRYHNMPDQLGNLAEPEARRALIERMLNEPSVRQWGHTVAIGDVELDRCTSLASSIDALYSAHARACGKDIWGDKTPSYITSLHVLNALFPEARFIHIIRDGRDVASSLVQQWWGPNDFAEAMRYWHERVSCARKMLRMLPENRFIEVRFEDLVANPRNTLESITTFLGLDFEEAMLDAYTRKASSRVGESLSEIHPHLHEKPNPEQAYKWKRQVPASDQAIAHEIAGRTLAELGYEQGATQHPGKLFRELYHRVRSAYIWRFGNKKPPTGG